jgi:uncharacterized protein (TIGR03435 family)
MILVAALAGFALAQLAPVPPAFEAGDIRVSPRSANPFPRGGYYPAGARYELHQQTMADLIRTAWELSDNNRVIGGPAWLDDTRFDVLAQAPDATSTQTAKLMLRTLLADRCGLVVREETRPIPAYVLLSSNSARPDRTAKPGTGTERPDSAGRAVRALNGKNAPRLKVAGAGETNAGGCQNQPSSPSATGQRAISCRNVTMEAFAEALHGLANDYFGHAPTVDLTGLKGSWDFNLEWTDRGQPAGSSGVSLFEAIDKQLGLRLEMQDTPLPVIVVDRANQKPAESTPETMRKLPRNPTEFEVGDIRPSPPGATPVEKILPGGEIEMRDISLKDLVLYAWDIGGMEGSNEELLAAPKWLDSERFDLVAKATSGKRTDAPPLDEGALRVMTRNLLLARFRMAVHYEDRPVTVYGLTAAKPKLTRADPSTRTACKFAALPAGSRSPLTRNFVCQNVTMSRFAEKLRDLATDYMDHQVVDATGLEGGWNFVLSFSSRGAMQAETKQGAEAADPDGRLTVFEAIEKELGLRVETRKAPMPVLVIDRVEREPTEN